MTIGTAIVASTNVRSTGVIGRSQSPSVRLMMVRVGSPHEHHEGVRYRSSRVSVPRTTVS